MSTASTGQAGVCVSALAQEAMSVFQANKLQNVCFLESAMIALEDALIHPKSVALHQV